jgi:hypothetical protein
MFVAKHCAPRNLPPEHGRSSEPSFVAALVEHVVPTKVFGNREITGT